MSPLLGVEPRLARTLPDSVRVLAHGDNGVWQDPEVSPFGSVDLQVPSWSHSAKLLLLAEGILLH